MPREREIQTKGKMETKETIGFVKNLTSEKNAVITESDDRKEYEKVTYGNMP